MTYAPWQRELDDREGRELSALCLLLARFEQAARSRVARDATIDQVTDVSPTLPGYRDALVNDDDLDDVCRVAPLIAAGHTGLPPQRPSERVTHCGTMSLGDCLHSSRTGALCVAELEWAAPDLKIRHPRAG